MRIGHLVLAPVTSLAILALSAACGGGGSGGGAEAKSPAAAASSTAPAPGPGAAAAADNEGTTTTTALGDGGDLQGSKLTTSSTKEVETKGESGPVPGAGHKPEPGRGPKDIQVIIKARRDEARACYDKALPQHPGIEGDLDVKWTIDPQGNVTDASVDSTKSQILEPSVGDCIVEIIKKIKFAPSAKGFETRAHYPFNFHPHNGPAKRGAGH